MMGAPTFYEFFAGGGMARAGLGAGWRCLFANDFEPKKCASYRANWGAEALAERDVRALDASDLPGRPDLVWASFPCQDLSLAGAGAGLTGERSGAFWPFLRLVATLRAEGRHPPLLALENVCGALTSHGGRDFAAICSALAAEGYRYGALVVDAALFVPQSRPRLFILAARADLPLAPTLHAAEPAPLWTPRALAAAFERLPEELRAQWLWWRLPAPPLRNTILADLIEDAPQDVSWRSEEETRALIALMSGVNRAKIEAAMGAGRRMVGTLYRRTRYGAGGEKMQRAEARFDDIAGCLRTPAGGSSRQSVLIVENGCLRSRLMSARETARLMGLPDDYALPCNYADAYHLTGDGVVVPAVRHLAQHLLEPALRAMRDARRAAA
jgi:DNA (cytosine-5)-methyltransferase 1